MRRAEASVWGPISPLYWESLTPCVPGKRENHPVLLAYGQIPGLPSPGRRPLSWPGACFSIFVMKLISSSLGLFPTNPVEEDVAQGCLENAVYRTVMRGSGAG